MDTAQRQISKIKNKLPANNLQAADLKFVAELVSYIGVINGRAELSVSIHDSFASRYKVIIAQMPLITLDDVRQVEMMNGRIKSIRIDLQRKYLIVESWKDGKKKLSKKKRSRETDDYIDLPSSFNLKEVLDNDKRQVEGILKLFVNYTTLEFNVKLEQNVNSYVLMLSNIEELEIIKIDTVLRKFKAFITEVEIDFPHSLLRVTIRKSDSPLEKIAPVRKLLKIRKKNLSL